MTSKASLIVARGLWFFPAVLLVLSIALVRDSRELARTFAEGEPARAEILDVHKRERADVTYGHVELRAVLSDGTVVQRVLPLPLSLIPQIETRSEVDVHVLLDSDKTMVIDAIARPQRRMAAIQAFMSFVGMLLLSWAIFAWNRFLTRHGDPALAQPGAA
jgi:hypothetical protein